MAEIIDFTEESARADYYRAQRNLETGTYSDQGDVIDWTYFDTWTIDPAANRFKLFVNQLGQSPQGFTKTGGDTNVESLPAVPKGQWFAIRAIKLFYKFAAPKSETALTDVYNWFKQTVFNFNISSKASMGKWALDEMFNIPIMGVHVPSVPGDTYNLLTYGRNVAAFPVNLPLIIASLVTFSADFETFNTATAQSQADDQIKCCLSGILRRTV